MLLVIIYYEQICRILHWSFDRIRNLYRILKICRIWKRGNLSMWKSQCKVLNSPQSECSRFSYIEIPYGPLYLTYKHIHDRVSQALLYVPTARHAMLYITRGLYVLQNGLTENFILLTVCLPFRRIHMIPIHTSTAPWNSKSPTTSL